MNAFTRILAPEVFQGEFKWAPYFEGWYFKA